MARRFDTSAPVRRRFPRLIFSNEFYFSNKLCWIITPCSTNDAWSPCIEGWQSTSNAILGVNVQIPFRTCRLRFTISLKCNLNHPSVTSTIQVTNRRAAILEFNWKPIVDIAIQLQLRVVTGTSWCNRARLRATWSIALMSDSIPYYLLCFHQMRLIENTLESSKLMIKGSTSGKLLCSVHDTFTYLC